MRVIDLFGVERCFFASNFPVDLKSGWPAARLFGAFARLVGAMPEADRQRLFADNAPTTPGAPTESLTADLPLPQCVL